MNRSVATMLSRALLAPALVALLGAAAQAQITYTLIDGAAGDQAGHTLEGTITFDSACGTGCGGANIVDFDFEVSGPNNYSLSYQSPADVAAFDLSFLTVTATEVTFDATINGGLDLFRGDISLTWSGGFSPTFTSGDIGFGSAWSSTATSGVIASVAPVVPEPSMVFAVTASGLLALCRRTRNRHA